jgi:hypothetical protein
MSGFELRAALDTVVARPLPPDGCGGHRCTRYSARRVDGDDALLRLAPAPFDQAEMPDARRPGRRATDAERAARPAARRPHAVPRAAGLELAQRLQALRAG